MVCLGFGYCVTYGGWCFASWGFVVVLCVLLIFVALALGFYFVLLVTFDLLSYCVVGLIACLF